MKTEDTGAAAAAQAGTAEAMTEESLAWDLSREMEQAGQSEAAAPTAKTDTADDANAAADGDSTAETEAESEAKADDASEGKAETESAEALSQAEKEEGSDEAAEDAGPKVTDIPELTPEQKQHVSEIVQDRVRKVTEKLRAAQSELDPLRTELETAKARITELEANPATGLASAENPLQTVTSEGALQKKADEARAILRDCNQLLPRLHRQAETVAAQLKRAGVKLTDDEGNPDYSTERMREFLEETKATQETLLQEHLPARQQQLAQQKAFDAEAMQTMPWLKEPANAFTRKVNEVLQNMPDLARLPYGKLLVARAVFGSAKLLEAAKKPKTDPPVAQAKPPKARPPVVARPAAVKPRTDTAKSAALQAAEKKFAETGSVKDLEALEALGG